jgi:hypothetical protein
MDIKHAVSSIMIMHDVCLKASPDFLRISVMYHSADDQRDKMSPPVSSVCLRIRTLIKTRQRRYDAPNLSLLCYKEEK